MSFIDDVRSKLKKTTLHGVFALIFSANAINSPLLTDKLVIIVANILLASCFIALYFSGKVLDKINLSGSE